MRAIKDMSILEIDITNACMNKCSNCTRFCGHHQTPYFMDFETFKRAIDSLDDFEGLISIMGGEPLLHPEFERFVDYLEKKRKTKALFDHKSKAIVKDYLSYAQAQRWFNNSYNKGAGYNIFTSIPMQFYQHYEKIQDTFTHMFLNDHTHPSFHQPILISRKDLGITDEDFAVMREKCWLQNFWSASITPKGAFFCEIAGTLDMLLNGPGGWRIEPGWWKRDIEDYKEQFHYCDLCGMALKTFSRNANDEMDDASITLYEKIKSLNTPRFRQNRVQLYRQNQESIKDGERFGEDMSSVTANYEPDYEKRVGTAATNLRPRRIIGIIFVKDEKSYDDLEEVLDQFEKKVHDVYIVSVEEFFGKIISFYSKYKILRSEFSDYTFGAMMNVVLHQLDSHDWGLILEKDASLPENFSEMICNRYLNPGYLFECNFSNLSVILFNKLAFSLKKAGFDGIHTCKTLLEFMQLWGEKRQVLKNDFDKEADLDIEFFRKEIYENYLSDTEFLKRLEERLMECQVKKGDTILVTHSAFIFHTTSIIKILENLGYDIRVVSSKKFKAYFVDWIDDKKVFYFEGGLFKFDEIQSVLEEMKSGTTFVGAIIPFFPGASTVKEIDAYTDVLKSAKYIAKNILGIINIRREFVDIEYEY